MNLCGFRKVSEPVDCHFTQMACCVATEIMDQENSNAVGGLRAKYTLASSNATKFREQYQRSINRLAYLEQNTQQFVLVQILVSQPPSSRMFEQEACEAATLQ